jgi:SIR2-like domain
MASQESQSPLDTWRKKLAYLQNEEAITPNPAQKFEVEQQIKECKHKIDELTKEGTGRSIISPVPNPVNEEELSKHFQEVAKSLRQGSLIFFIGSGVNSTKDSNLPPTDEQIAEAIINEDMRLETNKLIGFPCEICPLKTVNILDEFQQKSESKLEISSDNRAKIKPSYCPFIENKTSELRNEQRLREAKYELRCRAQFWKDKLHAEDGLVEELSFFFQHYNYKPNSLQQFLADLVKKIKKSRNSNYEHPYQLIVTTTYDCGLERAFEDNEQNIDVLSYIAQGEERCKFRYICYKSQDGYYQNNPDKFSPVVIDPSNPDIISGLKEFPLRYIARLECPIILKIYGGVLYKKVDPHKDSFFIPGIHHINYLKDNKNDQIKVLQVLPDRLIKHWNNSQILFIGYSANDPDLRVILECFRKNDFKKELSAFQLQGWLIHQSDPGGLNDQNYWQKHWGVQLIQCSWKDYVTKLNNYLEDQLQLP